MSKTILLGGSGFLGPVILSKDSEIISIGRSPIESSLKNKHLDLPSLDNLEILNNFIFKGNRDVRLAPYDFEVIMWLYIYLY